MSTPNRDKQLDLRVFRDQYEALRSGGVTRTSALEFLGCTSSNPQELKEALSLAQRWRGIYTDETYGPSGRCLGVMARALLELSADNMRCGIALQSATGRTSDEEAAILHAVLNQARETLFVSLKGSPEELQRSLGKLNLACKAHYDWRTEKVRPASTGANKNG